MPQAFPPDARERLKTALVERVLPRFGPDGKNSQSAAAEALGVDQSTISKLVKQHPTGGSIQLVEKVAKMLNEDPSLILLGTGSSNQPKRIRDLPDFVKALTEAKTRAAQEHPNIRAEELEFAADTRVTPEPQRATAGLLIHIALANHSQAPSETHHKRPRRRT